MVRPDHTRLHSGSPSACTAEYSRQLNWSRSVEFADSDDVRLASEGENAVLACSRFGEGLGRRSAAAQQEAQ